MAKKADIVYFEGKAVRYYRPMTRKAEDWFIRHGHVEAPWIGQDIAIDKGDMWTVESGMRYVGLIVVPRSN